MGAMTSRIVSGGGEELCGVIWLISLGEEVREEEFQVAGSRQGQERHHRLRYGMRFGEVGGRGGGGPQPARCPPTALILASSTARWEAA